MSTLKTTTKRKIRPARKQVAPDQIDKAETVQTGKEYSMYLHKHSLVSTFAHGLVMGNRHLVQQVGRRRSRRQLWQVSLTNPFYTQTTAVTIRMRPTLVCILSLNPAKRIRNHVVSSCVMPDTLGQMRMVQNTAAYSLLEVAAPWATNASTSIDYPFPHTKSRIPLSIVLLVKSTPIIETTWEV